MRWFLPDRTLLWIKHKDNSTINHFWLCELKQKRWGRQLLGFFNLEHIIFFYNCSFYCKMTLILVHNVVTARLTTYS